MFGRGPDRRGTFAAGAHGFWLGAVRLLAHAWIYSYFWSAAALLYLWLRHEVDGTPTTVIDPARSVTPASCRPGTDRTRFPAMAVPATNTHSR